VHEPAKVLPGAIPERLALLGGVDPSQADLVLLAPAVQQGDRVTVSNADYNAAGLGRRYYRS
jgi:hypothetical protein